MLQSINGPSTFEIRLAAPWFCPFLESDYSGQEPFELEITELNNNICSGSPWVMGADGFAGFAHFAPGTIRHHGAGHFEFTFAEEQQLLYAQTDQPAAALDAFNQAVIEAWPEADRAFGDPEILRQHEYCTWVEQRLCRTIAPEPDVLTQEFADRYLDRILQLECPPGKFTLDHGWFPKTGPGSIGDWAFDRKAFPNPDRFIARLVKEGFTPGIWLAPLLVQEGTKLHAKPDSRSGRSLKWGGIDACGTDHFDTLAVNESTEAHYRAVIRRLSGMGFRKFKLDIFYAPKAEVAPVLEMIGGLIREIDSGAEIEAHTPDIHLSRYVNVIRANDVWLRSSKDLQLAADHIRVCRMSAPHRITNLDHLAGNAPRTPQDLALAHIGLCTVSKGYPVVSALPDRYGKEALDLTLDLLRRHAACCGHLTQDALAARV